MPSLDYLLGEISVDGPEQRAEAVKAGNTTWPEGFWGVSDEHHGYVAYFAFEPDAWAYRMILINSRMNMPKVLERYAEADRKADREGSDKEWVVGTEASNGTFFMNDDCKPTKSLDEARGFLYKKDAENYTKYFKKPNTFVKQRKACR